jgi:hypothetical protein
MSCLCRQRALRRLPSGRSTGVRRDIPERFASAMTATAIYNHFDSREDLLYAADVRGLQRMTDPLPVAPATTR